MPDLRSTPVHFFLNLWRQEEPFRLHRLEVDLPQQAWAEADGRVAFLQYGMKDQHGRVHRLARCVIPASQVAADHLLDRISYGRPDRAGGTARGWRRSSGRCRSRPHRRVGTNTASRP